MKKQEWIDLYEDYIASFERVEENITDIILLGDKGGIRRIIIEVLNENKRDIEKEDKSK